MKLITEALEKLQKSERTVEDVKDQHLTMSGELTLKGGVGSIAGTAGLNTSGLG